MRIFHFKRSTTTILNICAWPVLHILISFVALRIPPGFFEHTQWLFRTRDFEKEGALYERLFNVTKWKRHLPDAGRWFKKGFSKQQALSTNSVYLERFIRETSRAEMAHLATILISPVFFLWNPRFAGLIHVTYALAANLPFVIVQRYNRPQLSRILSRKNRIELSSGPISEGEENDTIYQSRASGETQRRDHGIG